MNPNRGIFETPTIKGMGFISIALRISGSLSQVLSTYFLDIEGALPAD